MASINKVIIIGNLGKDPEVRYTQTGTAMCNLTVATTRQWKNKDSGERMEETEWHRVSLFDRQAEVAGEYLKKGSSAYFEGRLRTRKWTDKEGQERYTTEIVADVMQLLGSRQGGGGGGSSAGGDDDGGYSERPAPQRSPSARPQASAPRAAPAPKPAATGFDNMDDDIPF